MSMSRLELLEHRVQIASKLSALGPFVPGDGEGSTIKTHRMVMSLDVRGMWAAFMYSEREPLHGNPDGVRSVHGWGLTKEEAAKDAFALLWYPRGSRLDVMPPDVAQSMHPAETERERHVRLMGEALLEAGLVLMPMELMWRAVAEMRHASDDASNDDRPATSKLRAALADELQQYLPVEKS